MQNLILFFQRFRFFIAFIFIQITCFYLYFQFVNYPKSVLFGTTSTLYGRLLSWEKQFIDYFNLAKRNRELMEENSQLRGAIFDNYYQIQRPVFTVNDTTYKQLYRYIPALVINATTNKKNNYFTINVGEKQNIKKDMGVISNKGVVGVVFAVGEEYSLVRSVLTSDINLLVKVGKDENDGVLKWNGENPTIGTVTNISTEIPIKPGSEVRTAGITGLFPRGILIGKVKETRQMENQPLWDIDVLFAENFRALASVYVINDLNAKEIIKKERNIPKEKTE